MKYHHKFLICFILLLVFSSARCQQLSLDWYSRFGSEGWDFANASIVTHDEHHVFAGTCLSIDKNDSIVKKAEKNGWIGCLDSLGNINWEKYFRATDFVTITSLTNKGDAIYFTGLFNDTIYYDSTSYITADSYMSSFYGYLNLDGEVQSFKKFGYGAIFKDILISSNSTNLFIVSTFSDTLALNNVIIPSQCHHNAMISKIVSEETLSTSEISRLSGTLLNISSFFANDSIIYIAGSFSDSIHFLDSLYISTDQIDSFVASLNLNNQSNWFKSITGNQNQIIRDIILTTTNDIGIIGSFEDKSIFLTDTLSSIGCYDIFLYLIDDVGNLKWSKRIGNISNDHGYSISSEYNNLFISGSFAYSLEIPKEFGDPHEFISSSPFGNSFVAKFNHAGTLKGSYTLPGTSEDYCVNLNIKDDKITAIGNFYNILNLTEANGNLVEINSAGDKDIFVLHFNDLCKDFEINAGNDTILCPGSSTVLNSNELLTSYIWEPGGNINSDLIVIEPGKYYLTGINDNGCIAKDSLLISQAEQQTIYAGADTIIIAGDQLELLTAENSDSTSTVTWASTGNGYFGNENSLHTYYSPSYNDISIGDFILKLNSNNICGTATDSLNVSIVKDDDGITAYPNPTQEDVTLICDEGITILNISITNQSGYIFVNDQSVNNYYYTYNLNSQVPGTYLFYILTNEGLRTKVINKI